MKWFPALIALLLFCLFSRAQQGAINQRSFFFNISSTATPIQVNGDLDEPIWQTAEQVSRFNMRFPNDTAAVKAKTSVQVCYDNRFIYIAAVCSDTTPNVVQSLKRDVNFNDNDMFAVVLDPFNEQANGYVFGVNPLNVQYDDLLSSTNLEPQNFGWDNKWYSAVKRMPGKWVVEMAIPFKILRYPANKTTWGINFLRNDLKHYQYSTWAKVPVQFTAYDLGYTGAMHWAAPPVKQHNNIVLSPFVTGAMVKPQGNAATEKKLDAGFDAKIALNSSLNLDLTVNPDFSQIEVDVQQINLTRYNIFFPERRTFFLENNDLFFNFGSTDYRPYYSRTIGLDSQAAAIPILAGLRLTGNLTKKMRVGIMNMHTRATSNYKAQNYSAVAINQRVLKRSVLKAFFNNRQAFDKDKGPSSTDYGRNMGSEFNFFSKTGKWVSWLAGNWSFKNGYKKNNQFLEAGVAYTSNNFNSVIDLTDMGTNYYADMGFINRIENYDALRDTFIRVGFKQAYNQN
ncbi:MAG: carbohydrate binding family 9 domain-containing protein, partial [Dinghuibacter sp.]|nr:carbohydrate binding family 9 domain-containing protein [Dinghuibacter sp.]